MNKMRILILCTANRARSQMAEAWLRHFSGDLALVRSAGTLPKPVHPLAIQVMAESGLDLSGHESEHVDQYVQDEFDVVVTVCDRAREVCPTFPRANRLVHHSFDDPDVSGVGFEKQMRVFRRVRDEIRDWARAFVGTEVGGQ